MADEPEGKLEMAIRVLGNELFAFKMTVDDFKMKWVLIGVVALVVMLWAVGSFGPQLQGLIDG